MKGVTAVQDFDLVAVQLTHDQTNAQHLHLARNDSNNAFGYTCLYTTWVPCWCPTYVSTFENHKSFDLYVNTQNFVSCSASVQKWMLDHTCVSGMTGLRYWFIQIHVHVSSRDNVSICRRYFWLNIPRDAWMGSVVFLGCAHFTVFDWVDTYIANMRITVVW